jgi:hypothetical protein
MDLADRDALSYSARFQQHPVSGGNTPETRPVRQLQDLQQCATSGHPDSFVRRIGSIIRSSKSANASRRKVWDEMC